MLKKILNLESAVSTIITLLFIGFSIAGPAWFEIIDRYTYDMGMRLTVAQSQGEGRIVLIDIDDKSLDELGPWPWPRHLLADLVDILNRSGASIIGLDLPFYTRERNQGLGEVKAFKERFRNYPFDKKDPIMIDWIDKNITQMEKRLDNDSILEDSVVRKENVILPVFGRREGTGITQKKDQDPFLSPNYLKSNNLAASLFEAVSMRELAIPYPELARAAMGMGLGNPDLKKSMAGRAWPMFVSYGGALLPSFPLRIAIAFFNQKPAGVLAGGNRIQLAGRTIPLVEGEMLIKFRGDRKILGRHSFVDILREKTNSSPLKGKIILIGQNHRDTKRLDTPLKNMTQTELTLHALDNIISGSYIVRPPYMGYVEILLTVFMGGLGALLFPRVGLTRGLGMLITVLILGLVAAFVLFSFMNVWLKTSHFSSCLLSIYIFVSLRLLLAGGGLTKHSSEQNRLLGVNFQNQGLLDLAFEKFRKLPLDSEAKNLIYNLGLEFESKRMIDKALSVYAYANRGGGFRDLDDRISRLRASGESSSAGNDSGTDGVVSISGNALGDASLNRPMVGRYEVLEELGKGSMGLVYRALDPKINRHVAIKTIRFSDEFEEDLIEDIKARFFREAEIAGQLSHPSIVTIYDVGEDGDLTYMAMEYLEGEDFEKYIEKQNLLPFRQVLDVVAKVADTLDFAHKADVIHRDIKPANIMLLKNGRIKVTDFGIAKAVSTSRTRTGVILGTPNYMSPEQIMGQKIDQRSDIFSLGVLFFQLLAGELPFHAENLSNLLFQITQVQHPSVRDLNPKIPRACEQIIDKALEKNPDDRYAEAKEMAGIIRLVASKVDELMKRKPSPKK